MIEINKPMVEKLAPLHRCSMCHRQYPVIFDFEKKLCGECQIFEQSGILGHS